MNEQDALQILRYAGAVIGGHFVDSSGKHCSVYINKYNIYLYPRMISELCSVIAEHFSNKKVHYGVDAVVGSAINGALLGAKVAELMGQMDGSGRLSLFVERMNSGEFIFRHEYDKIVPGRRVLVVEDMITMGGSAKNVIELVRELGGKVIGLGAFCNIGGVTLQDVANPPELFALAGLAIDAWDKEACPLCAADVPIDTDYSTDKMFLARWKAS